MQFNFSWSSSGLQAAPRLFVSAEDVEFDSVTLQNFRDEGFDVTYLPFQNNTKEYQRILHHVGDQLGVGEKWALIAYGDAASTALEIALRPITKLAALICYYPGQYPKATVSHPPSIRIQVHLASSQSLGTKYSSFTYPSTQPGFAEGDLEEFDKVSSRIAWTRSLKVLREAFGINVDFEKVWEQHLELEFVTKDADKTMETMVEEPYVNHVPTMTGVKHATKLKEKSQGIGRRDLRRFYHDFFIPSNPPSMKMRLLSRTVGTDRVVDEMHISLRHTQEIPWLLPGVPPTDKLVEVALVSVVCIRGGKLYHEHIYWDQATVLAQVGLLDPKLIPDSFKGKIDRIPVVGAEGARKVVDEDLFKSNELIKDW